MKSADEIKKGLECCAANDCNGCGYNCGASTCIDPLLKDISSLIQQLQAENAEKAERIKQLEAELGAAVSFLKGQCWACKFSDCSFAEEPCASCFADRREKWQWRGVQKEE